MDKQNHRLRGREQREEQREQREREHPVDNGGRNFRVDENSGKWDWCRRVYHGDCREWGKRMRRGSDGDCNRDHKY